MGLFSSTPEIVPYDATQTVNPPGFSQPYLGQQFQTVGNQPGSVPLSPYQTAAAQGGANAAMQFGPVVNPALQLYQDTVGGQYLQPDVIRQAADPYIREFAPQVHSNYASMGRSGSPAAGLAFGRGVGDIIAKQYQQERSRQQQMGLNAPMFEQLRTAPYETAFGFGELERQAKRQGIADEQNKLQTLSSAAAPYRDVTNEQLYVEGGGDSLIDILGGAAAGVGSIDEILKYFGKGGLETLLGGGQGLSAGEVAGDAASGGGGLLDWLRGGGSGDGGTGVPVGTGSAVRHGLNSLLGLGGGSAGALAAEAAGAGALASTPAGAAWAAATGLAPPAGAPVIGAGGLGAGGLGTLGMGLGAAGLVGLASLLDNSTGVPNPAAGGQGGAIGQPLPGNAQGDPAKSIRARVVGGVAQNWGTEGIGDREEGPGEWVTINNPKLGPNEGGYYIPVTFLQNLEKFGYPDLDALSRQPGNPILTDASRFGDGESGLNPYVTPTVPISPAELPPVVQGDPWWQNLTQKQRFDIDREMSSGGG